MMPRPGRSPLTMDHKQARALIAEEFAAAERAARQGNYGMVRVCARRAAGAAIRFWVEQKELAGWPPDAMSQLRALQLESSLPEEVRQAAERLSTRITQQFTSPFPTDPVRESMIIVDYLLGDH
jgi:hypothetical protein